MRLKTLAIGQRDPANQVDPVDLIGHDTPPTDRGARSLSVIASEVKQRLARPRLLRRSAPRNDTSVAAPPASASVGSGRLPDFRSFEPTSRAAPRPGAGSVQTIPAHPYRSDRCPLPRNRARSPSD